MNYVEIAPFDVAAINSRIGGNEIDIEFQRLRARAFHVVRIIDPAAVGNAIEAGDHRDFQRGGGVLDEGQVTRRIERIGCLCRKIAQRFAKTIRTAVDQILDQCLLAHNLLLENGRQHHCPGAMPLKQLEIVQFRIQRTCARNQRACEREPEIGGGQVHFRSLQSGNRVSRIIAFVPRP